MYNEERRDTEALQGSMTASGSARREVERRRGTRPDVEQDASQTRREKRPSRRGRREKGGGRCSAIPLREDAARDRRGCARRQGQDGEIQRPGGRRGESIMREQADEPAKREAAQGEGVSGRDVSGRDESSKGRGKNIDRFDSTQDRHATAPFCSGVRLFIIFEV